MIEFTFWTLVVGGVTAVMCALIGVWLVLTRESMAGDAISHGVLPGLVLVFLLFGTRAPLAMLAGAAVAGVATVLLAQALHQTLGVKPDASSGIVFSLLFAAGVVLLTRHASQVDLDPSCVLYGLIEFSAVDTFDWFGAEIPRALQNSVPASVVTVAGVWLARRELRLAAFDAAHAFSIGRNPRLVLMGLMVLTAIATVASFEAVGSILVIALLVGPAATAQLVSGSLRSMHGWSIGFALSAVVIGFLAALVTDTSVAGLIAAACGLQYAVVAVVLRLRARRPRPAQGPSRLAGALRRW